MLWKFETLIDMHMKDAVKLVMLSYRIWFELKHCI